MHFSYYYSLHGKPVPQRIDFESIARDYVDFIASLTGGEGMCRGTSERVASREVASREVASWVEVASRKVASREVASREVASREVASREVACRELASWVEVASWLAAAA